MSWIALFIAGCMEIVGVAMMKKLVDSGKKIFLLCLILCFLISFSFMSFAMQEIPMGVVYPIWTGIGAAGGVIVGILFFKESKNFSKLFFLAVIIVSSIGLKVVT